MRRRPSQIFILNLNVTMLSYQTVASFEKQCEIKKDLEFGIVLRIEINKFKHEKLLFTFEK